VGFGEVSVEAGPEAIDVPGGEEGFQRVAGAAGWRGAESVEDFAGFGALRAGRPLGGPEKQREMVERQGLR